MDVKIDTPASPGRPGAYRPHVSCLLKTGLGHAQLQAGYLLGFTPSHFLGTSWAPNNRMDSDGTTTAFGAGHCGWGTVTRDP